MRQEDGAKHYKDRPEGEHAQLLHDVKFAGLVKVKDIREQPRIPVKVKLFLLHIIVITHLQDRREEKKQGRQCLIKLLNVP